MPKISVVMPVYNTKKEYLEEAIESILNQTYKDFEFIIVDDGSDKNDVKGVVSSYSDDRIKYFYKENGGIADALNFGLDRAQGEYIARMDSDDKSLPQRFEKQVEYLDNHPEISVLGGWFNMFLQGVVVKHPFNVNYLSLCKNCCVGHPTVMFRKADFEKYNLRYNKEFLCEDYELWSRAIRNLKIRNLQEVLLDYRWTGSNISVENGEFSEHVNKVRQNMLDFLTDNKEWQKEINAILYPPLPPIEIKKTKIKFIQKLFSIKNEGNKKVLRLFFIKMSFKKPYKFSNGKKRKPAKKIVKIMGGLGNQMFEYAFGRAIETEKEKTFYDISFYDTQNPDSPIAKRVLELQHFKAPLEFARNDESKELQGKCTIVEDRVNVYDEKYLNYKKGFFDGYFQTEKYFKNIRQTLLEDFTLKKALNQKNREMLEDIKAKENSVSLHIRRGDYVGLSDIHLLCGIDYYQKAIEYMASKVQNPHFYIFSDDIPYVKRKLKINYPYTIVDINSSKEGYFDMELMKNCKHNIIANSSFSWWGAWLNENPDKIVVAPKKWHKDNQNGEWDIIPDGWVVIDD